MRFFRMLLISVAITVPALPAVADVPQPTVEYSADSVMEAQGMSMVSRVYHGKNKERFEMTNSGMTSIMISRIDKKIAWMLMPDQKMYMEMDLKEAKQSSKDISDCRLSQKSLGTETVNGFKSTKNKITMTCPDKLTYDGHMWVTKEGIMMKMDAVAKTEDGDVRFRTELKNVKIGRQDPKLFEVPAGYKKMSIGGMFGGAMPFGSQADKQRNGDDETEGRTTGQDDPIADPVNKIRNFFGF